MFKTSKKIAALAIAGAMAFGVIGTAQAASAQQIVGVITVTPAFGNAADAILFERLQVTAGCPVGFQATAGTFAIQNGLRSNLALASTPSTPTTDGSTGLNGAPVDLNRFISPPNPHVSNKTLDSITNPLVTGDWELRRQCFASSTAPNFASDPWFSLAMTFDAATQNWAVKGIVVPVPAQPTTVSLTASLNANNSATVTATVKDTANATATAAAGTVEFLESGVVFGTGVVANGVASFTTGVLAPGTYSATARFISSAPTVYANSAVSGSATVTVAVAPPGPVGPNQASTVIDVTIPAGTGSLTFTGLQPTISLGIAALQGGLFKASGNLGPVIVTDTRQLGSSPWSLTGIVTDFTSGTKTIDGKYLGWVPTLVGAATVNAGIAGPTVLPFPGSPNGLKTASTLSSGSVVNGLTQTSVSAVLNLAAPGNTPGGLYTSTLTLTLL